MNTQVITTQEINSSVTKLTGYREKQLKTLEENPFIEIVDNKSYEEAKKTRTNLVCARTEIEKVDKGIASILTSFRKNISDTKNSLIFITKPAEDLQQEEVKKWEEKKEQERLKKIKLEEERKGKIKEKIRVIIGTWKSQISNLTFINIKDFKISFLEEIKNTNKKEFEEFEINFLEEIEELKLLLNSKIEELKHKEIERVENEKIKKEQEEQAKKLEQERIKLKQEKEAQEKERKILEEQERVKNEKIRIQQEQEAQRLEEEKRKIELEKQTLEAEKRKQVEKKEKEKEEKRLEELKPDKERIINFLTSRKITEGVGNIKDKNLQDYLNNIIKDTNILLDSKILEIRDFK